MQGAQLLLKICSSSFPSRLVHIENRSFDHFKKYLWVEMWFRETYIENIVEVFFGNYQVLKKWWRLSWEKDLKLRVVFIGMSFSHIGWLISACATPRNPALPQARPWNPGVWPLWLEGVGLGVKSPRERASSPSYSELTLFSHVKWVPLVFCKDWKDKPRAGRERGESLDTPLSTIGILNNCSLILEVAKGCHHLIL